MTHMYFSARTEGIRTFRHPLRAAYRTAISAAQILVLLENSAWLALSREKSVRRARWQRYIPAACM